MTVAQFMKSTIMDAKHEKLSETTNIFFLFTKFPAYRSLKVSDINEKNGCFQQSFYV